MLRLCPMGPRELQAWSRLRKLIEGATCATRVMDSGEVDARVLILVYIYIYICMYICICTHTYVYTTATTTTTDNSNNNRNANNSNNHDSNNSNNNHIHVSCLTGCLSCRWVRVVLGASMENNFWLSRRCTYQCP